MRFQNISGSFLWDSFMRLHKTKMLSMIWWVFSDTHTWLDFRKDFSKFSKQDVADEFNVLFRGTVYYPEYFTGGLFR